mgnify:CR=1 FL=1
MDEFDKIFNESKSDLAKESVGFARMLRDMWNARVLIEQKLRFSAIFACVVAVLCLIFSVYLGTVVHHQSGQIQAIQNILDSGVVIEEVTTTTTTEETTQSVDGDSATINNGSWEQHYGQGGAE